MGFSPELVQSKLVYTNLNSLDEVIEGLRNAISRAHTAFEPVLYYASVDTISEGDRPAPASDVAMRIRSAEEQIIQLTKCLEQMVDASQV